MKKYIRKTSIEAYHNIKENGLLSKRRFEVYEFLFNNGPCTQRQVYMGVGNGNNFSSYTSRFSELRRMNLIDDFGTTICQHTGQTVLFFDVTENLPKKLDKKETKDQIINKLQNRIVDLEIQLEQTKPTYEGEQRCLF